MTAYLPGHLLNFMLGYGNIIANRSAQNFLHPALFKGIVRPPGQHLVRVGQLSRFSTKSLERTRRLGMFAVVCQEVHNDSP
jgi:hypothetical protein